MTVQISACKPSYMFWLCFLFSGQLSSHVISESTVLIFTNFSRLVGLKYRNASGCFNSTDNLPTLCNNLVNLDQLFHRRTRASYVYNVCLAWYNVVLTSRIHSSVKFVGLLLATRATVE